MRPRIICGFACAIILSGWLGCGRSVTKERLLRTSAAVQQLDAEQLKSNPAVRLRGVVTYVTGAGNNSWFYLQDGSGAVRVEAPGSANDVSAGADVEISGVAASSARRPVVRAGSVRTLRHAPLPPPAAVSLADLESGKYEGRRVAIRGILMSTEISDEGSREARELKVRVGEGTVSVRTADHPALFFAPVDAEVRVTGVANTIYDVHNRPARLLVYSQQTESIEFGKAAPAPSSLPVRRVADLIASSGSSLPRHRVRLRGRLNLTSQAMTLEDETGSIQVRGDMPGAGPGAADISGFAVERDGAISINNAVWTDEKATLAGTSKLPRPVFTQAAAIHRLSAREAGLRYPVRLAATVTMHNLDYNLLFVQDASDGIFVWPKGLKEQLNPGEKVLIEGLTNSGGFAPSIWSARVTRQGRAPLPPAAKSAEEEVFVGSMDCRVVQMSGFVESVAKDTLTVAWGSHRYQAVVYHPPAQLSKLTGATVEIQGVAGAITNGRRQLTGIRVNVPGIDYVKVLHPGAADPFSAPVELASGLLAFSPLLAVERRARLRGAVTLTAPDGTFWLKDSSASVEVHARGKSALAPGDLVDVSGIPAADVYSVKINDAEIRRIRTGPRPDPIPVDPAGGFRAQYDSQLVRIEAMVLSSGAAANGDLLLQAGSVPFEARLLAFDEDSHLPPAGTLVKMTGIYAAQQVPDGDQPSVRFRMIIGSPHDIQIVRAVSWWSATRLLYVIALGMLAIFAAVAWVVLLRREVRARVAETESALSRAIRAELVESRQKQVLDLIARNESLDTVLKQLAANIGELFPEIACSLSIDSADGKRLFTGNTADSFTDRPFSVCLPVRVDKISRGSITLHAATQKTIENIEPAVSATWVSLAVMTLERHDLHERLSFRASHDILTGLANRLAFAERLESEIHLARAASSRFALCYIDLNGFKAVNDTLGHHAGDQILRDVAQRLTASIRPCDMAARLGGDEFIILMPGIGDREAAAECANRLSAALSDRISAAAGISLFPADGAEAEALLRAADSRMYLCKHESRSGDRRNTAEDVAALASATLQLV